ncbi:gliding motility-associated C-terminal domain-containing protein [Pedobacter sp. P351]|uniref:gliding motility-associated C-terminal domain-containing protein n=1 Tax=Pedobacter superstes TaxID=3133441 RepID=UPI003096C776
MAAQAEIFIVSTTDDAGVGSMREALNRASANGNSEVDVIQFNLPGILPEQHTIKILSDFPIISSSVIIDASSQAGSHASVNGAKVIIDGSDYLYIPWGNQAIFKVGDIARVEMYGLVIRNFNKETTFTTVSVPAINVTGNATEVVFGAPGKGNVFYNVGGIHVSGSIQNLVAQSNYFGIKENGIDIATGILTWSYLVRVYNAILGGHSPAEGNLFYGKMEFYVSAVGSLVTQNIFYLIKNNIFTANIQEERPGVTVARNTIYTHISVDANFNHPGISDIEVTENVFGSSLTLAGFDNANIRITKNFFGTSRDKTKQLPFQSHALYLSHINGRVLIGGTNNSEGNIITNTNSDIYFERFEGAVAAKNVNKLELSHNSFYCNPNIPFLYYNTGPFNKPLDIFLDEKTETYVAGRTKAGAKVELYYTDPECTNCQPKRYFTTVYADAAGNWKYTGTMENGYSVMASATLNQVSSEFSDPRIYMFSSPQSSFKVTPQTCDSPNGKIEGTFTVNAKKVEWLNEAGNVISTNHDISQLAAGKYRMKAEQFGCIIYSQWVQVDDSRPSITSNLMKFINPACGNGGSILDVYPWRYSSLYWLDTNGNEISRERELKNVPAGSYTLRLINSSGCSKDFGPYTLINSEGPGVDDKQVHITNASCDLANGSISGLVVNGTGTISYKWYNKTGTLIGSTKDISNLPKGAYKLKVTDQSSCGVTESSEFNIEDPSMIEINESNSIVAPSACNVNTGSVKGLMVSGINTYQWLDENSQVVGTQLELSGVSAGTYRLKVNNVFGCTKTSSAFTVKFNTVTYSDYTTMVSNASCGLDNGSIDIDFGPSTRPAYIKVIDQNQHLIASTSQATGLKPGIYQIFFVNDSGCETLFKEVIVGRLLPLEIITDFLSINPDNCGQGKGSINGIRVTGGKAPYHYKWNQVSTSSSFTSLDLTGLKAGTYQLTVIDQAGCEMTAPPVSITNTGVSVSPPQLNTINTCPGSIIYFKVANLENASSYFLYEGNDLKPLEQNTTGQFTVVAKPQTTYFLSRKLGDCESEKIAVPLEFGDFEPDIPNTFTPNADGINDVWEVKSLEKYPGCAVSIYNRNGSLVYKALAYKAFDGTRNGQPLPAGTYYYVISLNGDCKTLSGDLTILR